MKKWRRPELKVIEVAEVEVMADLEVAFTSPSCIHCADR